MIQVAPEMLLDRGIYTPRQAALYARLQTSTLSRWIHGSKSGEAAVRSELGDNADSFVTFLDLVQALSIRAIRTDPEGRKIPLQRIRQLVDIAKDQYGIDYPLARKHTTYLFEDDIVLRIADDCLIQITGKYKKHHLISEVVETYADDLVHDELSGLAMLYTPMEYQGRKIILDPHRRFGEPMVDPCDYSVEALVTAARTEGTAVHAAESYGVDIKDIKIAQRYKDWLLGVGA